MSKEIWNKIRIPTEIEKTNNSAAIHMVEKPIPQIAYYIKETNQTDQSGDIADKQS